MMVQSSTKQYCNAVGLGTSSPLAEPDGRRSEHESDVTVLTVRIAMKSRVKQPIDFPCTFGTK